MRRVHELAQRLGKRFRALTRARNNEYTLAVAISVRHVNRALSLRFGERGLLDCTDDPDTCEQLRLVFFVAERDPLAERPAIGPAASGQIFVHHTDALRTMRICRSKEPSFAQRNAEGRKVIAVNGVGIMAVN